MGKLQAQSALSSTCSPAPSSPTLIFLTTQDQPKLNIKIPPESLPMFDQTGFARLPMTDDQLAAFVLAAVNWLLVRRGK